jgi:hypothetical protein
MELSFCHWKAQLPGPEHSSIHSLCHSSMCLLCQQAQQSTSRSCHMALPLPCWYTCSKGIILRPDMQHLNADFAGTWHKNFTHLCKTVLTWTGFIICYTNCPVLWQSTLQSEIALSTCEAEYIAPSMCTCSLIPMHNHNWMKSLLSSPILPTRL